jgi:DNA-binding PadR family transcriptional regulator
MARPPKTANALLGLLALRPEWSAWDLTSQIRRNMRFFWPRAESRILAELKRLDEDGFVRSRTEQVGQRPRTIYAITAKGRRRLSAWLDSPPAPEVLESEPILRVMLGDLGSMESLDAAIEQIEGEAHRILDVGRVVAGEYEAGTAPFQDQVHLRAFVFDYLTARAQMLLDWAASTRGELAEWPGLSEEERARRAIARIAERASRLPPP